MAEKVPNQDLLAAGLSLMGQAGMPLTKFPTQTRAMIYEMSNGEKVRVRTCNDHVLVVLAESPDADAKLNIEGTDHLLIVMPETERTPGPVIAYFVPTSVAIETVRAAHAAWLASNPSTNGNNRTWNLWFTADDAPFAGFAIKWEAYRLPGHAATVAASAPAPTAPVLGSRDAPMPAEHFIPALVSTPRKNRSLGDVIADARKQIADAAGVSIDAVKISVNLG